MSPIFFDSKEVRSSDERENDHLVSLKKLIEKADIRISEIISGKKPALYPDRDAKYFATFEVDLDVISQPMIADPDVNNNDISLIF